MDTPTASVEIVERDGETHFNISALTTANFSIQGELSRETATKLMEAIRSKILYLHEETRKGELKNFADIRHMALWRDDHFVNSKYVLCAHDHCNTRRMAEAGDHPWDLAMKEGWKLHMTSDLLCPDCSTTKEFCPWKDKKNGSPTRALST